MNFFAIFFFFTVVSAREKCVLVGGCTGLLFGGLSGIVRPWREWRHGRSWSGHYTAKREQTKKKSQNETECANERWLRSKNAELPWSDYLGVVTVIGETLRQKHGFLLWKFSFWRGDKFKIGGRLSEEFSDWLSTCESTGGNLFL